MPAEIVAAIDQLIDALARFSNRIDREVELVIDTGGLLTVMVADEMTPSNEAANSFDQAGIFENIESLLFYLNKGQL